MNALDALARTLQDTPPDAVAEVGTRSLGEDRDWAGAVAAHLASVEPAGLFRRALAHRVPNVQPTGLPVHVSPGRFALVVNHYDAAAFERQRAVRAITAHTHHFAFASRVCRGALYHIRFDDAGSLGHPDLTLRDATWLRENDVFEVAHREYHLVLAPEPDTVTLMIRGPAQFDNPHLGDPDFSIGEFERILAATCHRCAAAQLVSGSISS